jgi:probable HAF family extracellular repeat protein
MAARGQGWQDLHRLAGAILLGITLPAAASAEALYRYTDFGYATPTGINAGGDVVLQGGYNGVYHSYGAGAGTVSGPTSYGLNPGDTILGITDAGGVWGRRPGDNTFLARNGQVTEYARSEGRVVGANASGQTLLVQDYHVDSGPMQTGYRSFIDQGGQRTNLGTLGPDGRGSTIATAINNNGQAIGIATQDVSQTFGNGFLYKDGQLVGLPHPGQLYVTGRSINDHGHVVGNYTTNDSTVLHAFLSKDGQWSDLGTLAGRPFTSAEGINDSGQIVGSSAQGMLDDNLAFLWESGTMRDLNSLIANETEYTLRHATAINDAGQIIGIAKDRLGIERGFLLTPMSMAAPGAIPPAVPEPGTWASFTVLAIGLATRARRAKRAG